ncbi:MAG: hypothetical protein JWM77_2632 [Rhodospirillales bacterium]|nr:hypothetical protein [Rhodospirillales bacterium]
MRTAVTIVLLSIVTAGSAGAAEACKIPIVAEAKIQQASAGALHGCGLTDAKICWTKTHC